jgi:hypothetical protein
MARERARQRGIGRSTFIEILLLCNAPAIVVRDALTSSADVSRIRRKVRTFWGAERVLEEPIVMAEV